MIRDCSPATSHPNHESPATIPPNPHSPIPNPLAGAAAAAAICVLAFAAALQARTAEVLRSTGAVPAHIAGRFRDATGFQQASSGQYYVFDRRSHVVFGLDAERSSAWEIVHIGGEEGRIIDPTAFAVEPGGTFVVADAPNNRERIQIFTPAGFRIGGFMLPGRLKTRVVFDNAVLNGIGSLQYTGTTILMSQPETGALITVYELAGGVHRTIGGLRQTGHEDDRELHLALNSGIPLVDPTGGFYFVFQTGEPLFRKYDAAGQLVFERRMQGREIDELVASLPRTWPTRKTDEGEVPLVRPTIRTASVDGAGNLWVAFVIPYTYVFDRDGDKVRTVQFRGAGIIAPTSLFFGTNNRVLVTPGLYEFSVPGAASKSGEAENLEGSDSPDLPDPPDSPGPT
ncbi:MAG TPA: hypothetical protein VKE51_41425 [Vicinamibacterales bacterium]|nr:hypothetical protein [Vicinamibacterales bacterium]